MKRTPLLRKSGLSHTETADAKECAYQPCKKLFIPLKMGQKVCGPLCAGRKARADRLAERKQDRAKLEAMKPRRKWLAECQVVVNKCARLRDLLAERGCISCGAKPEQCFGGAVDAGHYRSVGSAPHLRFFLPQIRLQCVQCNRHLSGNAVEFRRGLVELMGLAWVERIEAMQGTAKWTIEYLKRLKAVMGKLARRLEARLEQRGEAVC